MTFNKLYIIIGAGSGLGNEFARHVSIKSKAIGIYNKTKRTGNKNIVYLKVNIENKKQIEKFFQEKKSFINKFKTITFVNFATFKKDDLILNIKNKDIKKTFSINLFSNIFFIQNLIRNFYSKKLNIIFISSSLGKNVDAGTLLYSSSKISLESLMKSIVIEYSQFNVRCNTLVLGFFKSPLWDKLNNNKYYITVILDGDDNDFVIEGQQPAYGRKLLDFISGSRTPSIYSLDKQFNKFRNEFSCEELIMNSISTHWVLSNKQGIPHIIKDWGLVDYDDYFNGDELVKPINLESVWGLPTRGYLGDGGGDTGS